MFDDMVSEKYGLKSVKFENMSYKERNKILMQMVSDDKDVVLFPRIG
jgi:hypothetical protein